LRAVGAQAQAEGAKASKNEGTKTFKTLFLLFMSYTHTFSICPSENPSTLAFSASHIENSLTA